MEIAKQVPIDGVRDAMVVVRAPGLGAFAPPVGLGCDAASAISRIHPDARIRPVAAADTRGLRSALPSSFPWISNGFVRTPEAHRSGAMT